MSSERAGVPISGALNREAARAMVAAEFPGSMPSDRLLDALEACVVPDPRITRIEALLSKYWEDDCYGGYDGNVPGQEIRAILRGDQ